MSDKLKIRILKPLKDYPAGKVISIDVDKRKVPIKRYWRNRISDSRIDKCIEIVMDKDDNSKKQSEKPKQNKKTGSKLK